MTETNPLLMTESEFQEHKKNKRENERKFDYSNTRFSYIKGNTKRQNLARIKQYNKAIKRYKAHKEDIKQKRIQNIKRMGKGFNRIVKRLPSIRYSEAGRARLVGALSQGEIPQNPLNAPSIYTKKPRGRPSELYKI